MDFLKLLLPASLACCCNALANMCWKLKFDSEPMRFGNIGEIFGLVFSGKILMGIFFYGISMLLFFFMLSNFKLSMIMPVTCLTYIFNILIAYFVFHEKLSLNQISGTVVIITGLIIISQSKV